MERAITLSYVITTRNKLPYLKCVLPDLLENVEADEEVVVVDGNSTDGTKEYLSALFQQSKIHQYISEPDKGEAHGWNKALLMAKGKLIKLISDDDVYYYPAIKQNKQFMLENGDIDAMMANTASVNLNNNAQILLDYQHWFEDWIENRSGNCTFCGLPLMLRKSSLPYIGLFDTSCTFVDLEYSVRLTTLKAKIAWNTALMVFATINQNSNTSKQLAKLPAEKKRIRQYYGFVYPKGEIVNYCEADGKSLLDIIFTRLKNKMISCCGKKSYPKHNIDIPSEEMNILTPDTIGEIHAKLKQYLTNYNAKNKANIIRAT